MDIDERMKLLAFAEKNIDVLGKISKAVERASKKKADSPPVKVWGLE